jgi:hypothetical protein
LKIKELKELLKEQRLPVGGTKVVLVNRLRAAKQTLGDNEVEQKEQE